MTLFNLTIFFIVLSLAITIYALIKSDTHHNA